MANTLRIRRRASGAAGAPASLANAELAFNEVDDTLYYGKGTGGGGGTATTVEAIGGKGAVVMLTGDQTIGGTKTFSNTIVGSVNGNAGTATKLATARDIIVAGDADGTASFDGSANATINITLDTVNSNVGTFTKLTVNAKGLVTAASAATLSDLGTTTADFSMGGFKITNLADPTAATDAASKQYVDNVAQGLDAKQSVRAATTADITLSGTQTIDGVSVVAGERVLVKNQSAPAQNGIYIVSATAWSRAPDMDAWSEVPSSFTFVEEGSTQADTSWVCSANAGGTLGTTAIDWFQFGSAASYLAGDGLSLTGNTFNVGTASTSRIVVNANDIDLATVGTAGTYTSVTTDAYGRVTAGTNPTTLAGYGITDAQPLDATLTALAGVTTAADTLIYATGADAFATTSLTSAGRALLDDADAAAQRTTLGLGTIATQAASNVAITGGSITNLTTFDGITIDGGTF